MDLQQIVVQLSTTLKFVAASTSTCEVKFGLVETYKALAK